MCCTSSSVGTIPLHVAGFWMKLVRSETSTSLFDEARPSSASSLSRGSRSLAQQLDGDTVVFSWVSIVSHSSMTSARTQRVSPRVGYQTAAGEEA